MSTHFGARPTGVKFATMVTMMVVMLWSEDCLIGHVLSLKETSHFNDHSNFQRAQKARYVVENLVLCT